MHEFEKRVKELKEKCRQYHETHGVVASAEAYMRRYHHREDRELTRERYSLFKELKEIIRSGREEGIPRNEIRKELQDKELPAHYIIRAERSIRREEMELERSLEMPEEKRQEKKLETEVAIRNILEAPMQDPIGLDPAVRNEEERLMKEARIRSELQNARQAAGLSDEELVSIAVNAGLTEKRAEYMVEHELSDNEEVSFFREEREAEVTYEEEGLIMH